MLREFIFKNNLLSDNIKAINSPYSVIGYYDGLDMKTFEDEDEDYLKVLSDPGIDMFKEIDKDHLYECYSIVGIREGNVADAEESFWIETENPFIFISCLRLKEQVENIEKLIEKVETDQRSLCYLSLDSSDLIICSRASSYREGYFCIEKYWEMAKELGGQVQKCFTNLVIKQEDLDNIVKGDTKIKDEEVSCILRCVIKDCWEKATIYMEELNEASGGKWKQFGILGSDDIIIKTESISITDLFKLYETSGLLTHDSKIYQDTFINVQTEILVERERNA